MALVQALPLTPVSALHDCTAPAPRLVRVQGVCTAISSVYSHTYACSWRCSSCLHVTASVLLGDPLPACCADPAPTEDEALRCELQARLSHSLPLMGACS